jgi:hypothetical protein
MQVNEIVIELNQEEVEAFILKALEEGLNQLEKEL